MLTSLELDALARAVSPALLRPYTPPMRAFSLGDERTFGIRRDYAIRTESLNHSERTRSRASHTTRLAAHVADACAAALHTTCVELAIAVTPSVSVDNTVLVCTDDLTLMPDPAPLLRAIGSGLEYASVVVIATTLRALTISAVHDDLGPPTDASLTREWTFPELQWCLQLFGIEPLFGGVTDTEHDTSSMTRAIGVIIATRRTPTARALRVDR